MAAMGVEKIISGGQRGADVAGLDVALELGIPIGGCVPRGRVQFGKYKLPAKPYVGMEEVDSDAPNERTERNIRHSDGTIIFSHGPLSHGAATTERLAWQERKPCLHADFCTHSEEAVVTLIRAWLTKHSPRVLNIAGPPDEPKPGDTRHHSDVDPSIATGRTLEPGEADEHIYEKVRRSLLRALLPQKLQENPIESAIDLRNEALYEFRQWDGIRWQVPYWFVTAAAAVVAGLSVGSGVNSAVKCLIVILAFFFTAISCRLLWNTMRYHDRLIEKVNADIDRLLVGQHLRQMFHIDLGFSFQWPFIMKTSAFWMVLFVGFVGFFGVPFAVYLSAGGKTNETRESGDVQGAANGNTSSNETGQKAAKGERPSGTRTVATSNHEGAVASALTQPAEITLQNALTVLQTKQFVDLTHAFEPGIPHWSGLPDEKREVVSWYVDGKGTKGKGFFAQQYTHVGQWGTHCDPPAHFAKEKRTIDQIDVTEMVLPLVVIDVHGRVVENPDYSLSMQDIGEWEKRHGPVPKGAFVAMRTDWSKRWPDPKAMRNEDEKGVAHYPGWSLGVLKFLYEERKITASGHETLDTDPGVATSKGDYSMEAYILGTDHYQIELLTHLDRVPESGAIAIVTFPKPKGGSGFPARVFAILP